MPLSPKKARRALLAGLNAEQKEAVRNKSRRLLVVAGAGSGKTEVMARRVAWWVAVDHVPKSEIVAFTFTDSAAEELKFRIRRCLEQIALPGEDPRLGGMYIWCEKGGPGDPFVHGTVARVISEACEDRGRRLIGRHCIRESDQHLDQRRGNIVTATPADVVRKRLFCREDDEMCSRPFFEQRRTRRQPLVQLVRDDVEAIEVG